MNTELANLAKEIGRIAQSQQGSVEWGKVAKFSEMVLIFDSPELESLNYHQVLMPLKFMLSRVIIILPGIL